MSPITHLLVSWGVANAAPLDRRERTIVTLAGVAPDLDGLGAIVEIATSNSSKPLLWWSEYHHILFHNLTAGLVVALIAAACATRRRLTAGLALLTFHLHLLGDIVGARGPDGYQWPIPYLLPFSNCCQLTWAGQWALNAWQNFVITGLFLVLAFYIALRFGRTPLEMFSLRADRSVVATLRNRFGTPG